MNRAHGFFRLECGTWFAIFYCLLRPCPVVADEATKQRFLNEYPAASKFLLDRFEHVRCDFESDRNPRRMRSTARFWRSGPYEKIESTFTGLPGAAVEPSDDVIVLRRRMPEFRIERTGDTPNYVDLTQRGQDSNLRWLLRRIRFGQDPLAAIREMNANRESWYWGIMNHYEEIGSAVVYAPWGGAPGRLADWLASGEATLIDANPVEGEPGMVEARIRKKEMQVSLDFDVRLDTNAHWALKSMEVSTAGTGETHHRIDVEYGEPIDSVAWPRAVTVDRQIVYRINGWTFEPTPVDQFRLTYYGLKPPPAEWDDTKILAPMVLAVMIAGALAFRFVRRKARGRTARAASTLAGQAEGRAVP